MHHTLQGWNRLAAIKDAFKGTGSGGNGGGSGGGIGSGGSGQATVRFDDIPWPSGEDDNILSVDVSLPADQLKTQIKQAQLRWHPDKFMQKYGMLLCDDGNSGSSGSGSSSNSGSGGSNNASGAGGAGSSGGGIRERVLEKLKHVVQCINALREKCE
jgi:hypothetical protein